jgi:hypothetical protein
MKVISFSLWGDDPKYNRGAIENAKLAAEIYPDWVCRFHYPAMNAPVAAFAEITGLHECNLEEIPNVQIRRNLENAGWRGMFWRFYDIFDNEVEVMISRDCDSRLSLREKVARGS